MQGCLPAGRVGGSADNANERAGLVCLPELCATVVDLLTLDGSRTRYLRTAMVATPTLLI
ncbi:hypothetical protein FRAHR75_720038 [Frankia sp. Hr75.2]|nr:hypothetical protein FRAHR75_720038 [Frankia sp. Hr75.2]